MLDNILIDFYEDGDEYSINFDTMALLVRTRR